MAAALGVLCLAACGAGSPPAGGVSPRPSLSLPVPSGSPGAGLPERTVPAPTLSPRPEPTATAPATEPPATEPPATAPPATEPPATAPPATAPPATAPPATAPPATAPPATAPPTTTPAPTAPPTTTPSATASPPATSTSNGPGWWLFLTGAVAGLLHRSSATPAPAAGAPAAPADSSSVSPWWWLLVVAIVVALVIGAVLLWRRRRRLKTWSDELSGVTTELRWADEQLVPSMLAAHTGPESARAWSDGRPRLVAADQQLYGLARRAPDAARAASIAELRESIAGLMSAVDAEARLTSTDPDALRAARADVERSRSRFSAALDAIEGKPAPIRPEPPTPALP